MTTPTAKLEPAAALRSEAVSVIDLRRSVPPAPPILGERLSQGLARLSNSDEVDLLLRASVAGGSSMDRRIGGRWLQPRFGAAIDDERILVTNGAQSAIILLLRRLVGQGGVLGAEALTYGVLGEIAGQLGVRVRPIALDSEGLIPEAFDEACRSHGLDAVYCNPTGHNPTTATMSVERRLRIAAIARIHGVAIIEDDTVGRLHPSAPPPLAAIAPDVTWYVAGLTKPLAHGMRLAYLVAPSCEAARALIEPFERLSHWFPAPLSAALMRIWIEDGSAEAILAAVRAESETRQRLAAERLAGMDIAARSDSLHLWLTLPERWTPSPFVKAAQDAGVLIRGPEAFAMEGAPLPRAVRLALSSPLTRAELETGLDIIARLL